MNLQYILLWILFLVTTIKGPDHETPKHDPSSKQAEFLQFERHPSEEPSGEPDAGRHSAVTDALLLPAPRLPGPDGQ